jgi:hypothetical protein
MSKLLEEKKQAPKKITVELLDGKKGKLSDLEYDDVILVHVSKSVINSVFKPRLFKFIGNGFLCTDDDFNIELSWISSIKVLSATELYVYMKEASKKVKLEVDTYF